MLPDTPDPVHVALRLNDPFPVDMASQWAARKRGKTHPAPVDPDARWLLIRSYREADASCDNDELARYYEGQADVITRGER